MSTLNVVKQVIEQAAEQKHVNYHLCVFHSQLIRILYFIMKFKIKPTRPFAYFDAKGRRAFFTELHTHPLITNEVDISIVNARKLVFQNL